MFNEHHWKRYQPEFENFKQELLTKQNTILMSWIKLSFLNQLANARNHFADSALEIMPRHREAFLTLWFHSNHSWEPLFTLLRWRKYNNRGIIVIMKVINYSDYSNSLQLQEGIVRLFILYSWLAYSFECCIVVSYWTVRGGSQCKSSVLSLLL